MKELQNWLTDFLNEIGACAGTVHVCEGGGLRLAAATNIPEVVQQAVLWVPSGKGMAGLALERGQPVTTCNLKDDRSGSVRPGARAVNAQAAVAMPIRSGEGVIVAVVGAAFAEERDIGEKELHELAHHASSLSSIQSAGSTGPNAPPPGPVQAAGSE
ncbi:MAG TPA: GAF domain-containing protein [Bryobacteraceae bacterium]|nr:GAF domain-containing protein [Bryobacteraceae bacterium]